MTSVWGFSKPEIFKNWNEIPWNFYAGNFAISLKLFFSFSNLWNLVDLPSYWRGDQGGPECRASDISVNICRWHPAKVKTDIRPMTAWNTGQQNGKTWSCYWNWKRILCDIQFLCFYGQSFVLLAIQLMRFQNKRKLVMQRKLFPTERNETKNRNWCNPWRIFIARQAWWFSSAFCSTIKKTNFISMPVMRNWTHFYFSDLSFVPSINAPN